MHPVVIMSYDKSPAITKAVAALEEAGMEVVVLNTKTAKLVQFLGALAGETDEEDTPAEEPKQPVEEPSDEEPEENKDLEPIATEGFIAGEKVKLVIVEGNSVVLHPSTIHPGAKTVYTINQSAFAFWPSTVHDTPISSNVELQFEGFRDNGYLTQVIFGESSSEPYVEIGREWLKEHRDSV